MVKLVIGALKHLTQGTFVSALKRQPSKFRRQRWEKFLASNKKAVIFAHKRLFKIKLYKDSELSQYIYQKTFEPNEIDFIDSFLKKGDVFVDVGTNIGFFSLMASKRVQASGHVYSFEPAQNTYNRLMENIKLNGCTNITPIKKAVSSSNGFLELNTSSEGYDAWNSFAKPFFENCKKETVEVITFSDFIAHTPVPKVDLVKIDVEGWEKFVVEGGASYFKQPNAPTILIEFVDMHTKSAGYSCSELYDLLVSYGYTFYKPENKSLKQEGNLGSYYYANLVATKDINSLKQRLSGWRVE